MRLSHCVWLMAAALVGCSAVPVATNHWVSQQPKLQSVAHWKALAESTAQEIVGPMATEGGDGPCRSGRPPCILHVEAATLRSPFTQAFDNLLLTALFNQC